MAVSQHYAAGWTAGSTPSTEEEVRTIFILGFPMDVKERELQNLLRWWPGYEACQMNYKGDQPMGFALFQTASMATAAKDALQNLVFDSESNSVLRAEMARKNLFVRKGAEGGKRLRTLGDYTPTSYITPPAYPAPHWAPGAYPAPIPPTSYDPYGYPIVPPPAHVIAPVHPTAYAPIQNTKDNPPCNTLFIGNLGEHISEAELQSLFSGRPGFKQLKVLRGASGTTCFVEFQDIASATAVHQSMQGAVLSTSDRGGMRIQFSKNPFGRKRDGRGPAQSAAEAAAVSTVPPGTTGEMPVPVPVPVPAQQQPAAVAVTVPGGEYSVAAEPASQEGAQQASAAGAEPAAVAVQ